MGDVELERAVTLLQAAGARLVYLHGSRAAGTAGPSSDTDVAALFGRPVDSWTVPLDDGVDLLVLDGAPLELAGRVALHGRLLFEADPAERVRWEATTRKVYLDEAFRRDRSRREFAAARRG